MNTPVNLELAKLLRSNKIHIEGTSVFMYEVEYRYSSIFVPKLNVEISYSEFTEDLCFPTISDVVMWIYKKHGIWIGVFNDDVKFFWMGIILKTKERLRDGNAKEFESPTKAYESAIIHVLSKIKNL